MNRKDFRPNENTTESRRVEQPTKPKKEVVDRFIEGKGSKTANKSLSSDGKELKSYDTVIAVRQQNGTVLVNNTKYSSTTSSQQNYLQSRLKETNTKYEVTGGKERGYKGEDHSNSKEYSNARTNGYSKEDSERYAKSFNKDKDISKSEK